jgi:hypothetical protein
MVRLKSLKSFASAAGKEVCVQSIKVTASERDVSYVELKRLVVDS